MAATVVESSRPTQTDIRWHECEWEWLRGDCPSVPGCISTGGWVRLIPSGLVNRMTLDLSRKPGWQRLRADDLRNMAAQAMRVPLEEVRCFTATRI